MGQLAHPIIKNVLQKLRRSTETVVCTAALMDHFVIILPLLRMQTLVFLSE